MLINSYAILTLIIRRSEAARLYCISRYGRSKKRLPGPNFLSGAKSKNPISLSRIIGIDNDTEQTKVESTLINHSHKDVTNTM
jgi:hypothetical protein